MEVNEPDFNYTGRYTYADYLQWTIEERLELIKGKIFRMSRGPDMRHQWISTKIFGPLWSALRNQRCRVFAAPFDVRLPRKSREDKDIITVLQPDLCVIFDQSKLDEKGCIGAPDIVVEILSPANNKKELKNKYEVYEESGVREYWIVSPQDKTLHLSFPALSWTLKKYLKINTGDGTFLKYSADSYGRDVCRSRSS